MLDYPNPEDRARYRALVRSGRVSRRHGIGGDIEIHGKGGRGQDWTQGCVALENSDMDDLVPRVRVGTPVTIVGMIPDGALP
jgi:L,D-peptidoglycan transpeptidase YkuD (ErfK/YbiS/YcfS/YnhG family)